MGVKLLGLCFWVSVRGEIAHDFSLLVDYNFLLDLELLFIILGFIDCLTSSASREGIDCGGETVGVVFWDSVRKEIAYKTLGHGH